MLRMAAKMRESGESSRSHQTVSGHPLPLPMGEVAERSEDGEGRRGRGTLSVTFGDSSPGGRAKELHTMARGMECIFTDTLHSLFYVSSPRRRSTMLCFTAWRYMAAGMAQPSRMKAGSMASTGAMV